MRLIAAFRCSLEIHITWCELALSSGVVIALPRHRKFMHIFAQAHHAGDVLAWYPLREYYLA